MSLNFVETTEQISKRVFAVFTTIHYFLPLGIERNKTQFITKYKSLRELSSRKGQYTGYVITGAQMVNNKLQDIQARLNGEPS